MSSEKAYSTGSALPVLKKDTLRMYSMRFCPFAHRTRLVLAHKNIPHEKINVNLKDKPDWFLERNPFGLVPILERNDRVVYESAICNDYLDDIYPDIKLNPTDPYEKARQRILMEIFGKWVPNYYQVQGSEDAMTELTKHNQTFENALKAKGRFFGGDKPGMLDFHMWPFFERKEAMNKLSSKDIVPAEKFPALTQWIKDMEALPAVKATMFDTDTHVKFLKSYVTGKPEYDIGL